MCDKIYMCEVSFGIEGKQMVDMMEIINCMILICSYHGSISGMRKNEKAPRFWREGGREGRYTLFIC